VGAGAWVDIDLDPEIVHGGGVALVLDDDLNIVAVAMMRSTTRSGGTT